MSFFNASAWVPKTAWTLLPTAVTHREGEEQARQGNRDRNEAPAPEEAEIRRQLDRVVTVVEPRGEQADQDSGEHAVVDLGLVTRLVDLARENDRRHRLEEACTTR